MALIGDEEWSVHCRTGSAAYGYGTVVTRNRRCVAIAEAPTLSPPKFHANSRSPGLKKKRGGGGVYKPTAF